MQTIISHSAAETEQIAAKLAQLLQSGDLIAFTGGLGAGKTAFVRGLASVLSPKAEVSSPTFALVHEYGGNPPFYHFDMYRITSYEDLESTGFFEYLDSGGILAVEWSENITFALPEDAIFIQLAPLSESERAITISGGTRFENFEL